MRKLLLTFVFASVLVAAQQPITVSATISPEAMSSLNTFLPTQAGPASGVLASPVLASDATVTMSNTASLTPGLSYLIEAEVVSVVSVKDKQTASVTRALMGTTAVPHASGITLVQLRFASIQAFLKQAIIDIVAQVMQSAPGPLVTAQQAAAQAAAAQVKALQSSAIQ